MSPLEQKALDVLLPATAYTLGVLFPGVPSFLWESLFAAIEDGDLTAEHITAFLAEHNIKTYQQFPAGVNGATEG